MKVSNDDEILQYYQREITYLRRMGIEFAQKYPKIAGRLEIGVDQSPDPHVERMLESFAFRINTPRHFGGGTWPGAIFFFVSHTGSAWLPVFLALF